jgi:hypothetical protein
MALPISHGVVLPDKNFETWLDAVRPYMNAFERVTVVRSPAGNDLNRFRDITAVQAPLVWHNNDALAHIRRAYPMVVRVGHQPEYPGGTGRGAQSRTAGDPLANRTPKHIFDRFVLEW